MLTDSESPRQRENANIDIEAAVFGRPVKLTIQLQSDDKPSSAGSVVDLIRLAKGALEEGIGGPGRNLRLLHEISAGGHGGQRGPGNFDPQVDVRAARESAFPDPPFS